MITLSILKLYSEKPVEVVIKYKDMKNLNEKSSDNFLKNFPQSLFLTENLEQFTNYQKLWKFVDNLNL